MLAQISLWTTIRFLMLSEWVLIRGARYSQKKSGTSKKEWDGYPSYGDDPRYKIYRKRYKMDSENSNQISEIGE